MVEANIIGRACFAAVATAKAELPSKKSFRGTLLFWVATSYVVGTMVYLIGTWWWTVFIFAALWAAAITLIVLTNKGKIKWPSRKAKALKPATPIGCVGCPSADSCAKAKEKAEEETKKKKSCCD